MLDALIITIDGPAGAGKSTVARQVAKRLDYLYIDTGAMYRCVALKCLQRGVDVDDEDAVGTAARTSDIRLEAAEGGTRVLLDGYDVTSAIRTPQVSAIVSQVAQIRQVRLELARLQRRLAQRGGVVLEGRDMGSYVVPDADRKFFLTAKFKERVRRRFAELQAEGFSVTKAGVAEDLQRRDRLDMGRTMAPLIIAEDAVVVDSSGKSVEEVVGYIQALCHGERAIL